MMQAVNRRCSAGDVARSATSSRRRKKSERTGTQPRYARNVHVRRWASAPHGTRVEGPDTMGKEEKPGEPTLVPGHTSLEPAKPRPSPRLRWTDGSGEHELELREPGTAGSSSNAELVLADRAVSRVHAQLTPKEDGLWVRDLGSRNGTTINGIAIVEARVPPGAVLHMGTTDISVSYGAFETADELWPEPSFGPLLGRTAVMRQLFAQLARFAKSSAAVLIHGESGTGKELVARALHEG